MAPPPTLRLDVRQPTPWRKAPTLLFGDRRRRVREWLLAGIAGTIGVVATLLLIVGLSHDGGMAGDPTAVAAAGPPPRASDFPLIEPRPAPHPTPTLRPTEPPAATSPPTAESAETRATETVPAAAAAAAVTTPPIEAPPASEAPAASEVAPLPSATPPHYLQLGTYRQRANAEADRARFATQGIATIILRRGDYYVLRLPPFADRAAAEAEETRLRTLGIDCLYIGPRR